MLRKPLTIFSLTGLLLSVGLWGIGHVGYLYWALGDDYEALVWAGTCRFRVRPPHVWQPGGVMADAPSTVFCQAIHPPMLMEQHIKQLGSRRLGGRLTMTGGFPGMTTHSVPLWIPSVVFLVLGLSCMVPPAYRRRKRKKLGLCVKCGYDLRASKDRCPECGEGFSN